MIQEIVTPLAQTSEAIFNSGVRALIFFDLVLFGCSSINSFYFDRKQLSQYKSAEIPGSHPAFL